MSWNLVLPGILVLGLVIFVHELGHFLMAKWRGVRVIRFSLGFGPAMFSFTRGGTEYRLAWIPFGGYVAMAGDSPSPEGDMPNSDEEFLSHPWYGRILIAAAGPACNLLTALIILCTIGMIGISRPDYPNLLGATPDTSVAYQAGFRTGDRLVALNGSPVSTWEQMFYAYSRVPKDRAVVLAIERPDVGVLSSHLTITVPADRREPVFSNFRLPPTLPIVGAVITGMPAYKVGIKEGDRILAVNGKRITTWDDLPLSLRGNVDRTVHLTVDRGGRTFNVDIVPMNTGAQSDNARIGIEAPRQGKFIERSGILESIDMGWHATGEVIRNVYAGMWLTVSRPLYYREYVGGPLFIAQVASEQAKRGPDFFLQFLAMINIAIMAFNLMPLPVLDGGHILLAVIEAIRRQKISALAYTRFQQVGLVMMGSLLVLILANDPWRVVQRQRALGRTSTSATSAAPHRSPASAP